MPSNSEALAQVHAELLQRFAPAPNCPNLHGLHEFSTCSPNFACDKCGDSFPQETTMFGCRICNYDVCTKPSCSGNLCLEPAELARRRCRNLHGMVELRWSSVRLCDECGLVQLPGSRLLSCQLCEFDLCAMCAGMHIPSWYEVLHCTQDCTDTEIRQQAWMLTRKYRKQCVHNPSVSSPAHLEAVAKFEAVTNAFVVLLEHREVYNLILSHPNGPRDWAPTAAPSFTEQRHAVFFLPPFAHHHHTTEQPPKVLHGVYVATIGIVWAPTMCVAYGVAKFSVEATNSLYLVASSCSQGASLVSSGVQQVCLGKPPLQPRTSPKIHIRDPTNTTRRRRRPLRHARNHQAAPWKRISLGLVEPVLGLGKGLLIVTVSLVSNTVTVAGGSCYGAARNLVTGCREVRQALVTKRGKT
ncbi:hypothetical protein BASA81_002674 [Batrachochytrium salamandrivorans]|nr:hypothetical protein BASA81_002674 [Batrachochytrium salamandrivorans]